MENPDLTPDPVPLQPEVPQADEFPEDIRMAVLYSCFEDLLNGRGYPDTQNSFAVAHLIKSAARRTQADPSEISRYQTQIIDWVEYLKNYRNNDERSD